MVPLGQDPDHWSGAIGAFPEDGDRAVGQIPESQDGVDEGGLADAIRAEHGDERANGHVEVDVGEDTSITNGDGSVPPRDRGAVVVWCGHRWSFAAVSAAKSAVS